MDLPDGFEIPPNNYPITTLPPLPPTSCRQGIACAPNSCSPSLSASPPSPSPSPCVNASSLHVGLDGPIALVWPVHTVKNLWHFMHHLLSLSIVRAFAWHFVNQSFLSPRTAGLPHSSGVDCSHCEEPVALHAAPIRSFVRLAIHVYHIISRPCSFSLAIVNQGRRINKCSC